MFDGDIVSVLPRHSTDFERALEQASLWVIQNSEIVDVWNPDTCPERFLPWLAWSVSVDEWDASWSLARKREVIRNSVAIHRLKGTPGAVRRAIAARGYSSKISEWFMTGDAVHTFRLDAFSPAPINEFGGSQQKALDELVRIINSTKAARSHLAELRIGYLYGMKNRLATVSAAAIRLHGKSEAHRPITNASRSCSFITTATSAVSIRGNTNFERRSVSIVGQHRLIEYAGCAVRFCGLATATQTPRHFHAIQSTANGGTVAIRVTGHAFAQRYSQ